MKNKILRWVLAICMVTCMCGSTAATQSTYAQVSDEQIRDDVTRAIQDMESIMNGSYERCRQALADMCVNGYDYELSMESFDDQGLPFSGYDYKEFIAVYTTIQEYCISNHIDLQDGINQIEFVRLHTSPATLTEYIPESLPLYKKTKDGFYMQDGTYYLTEPSDVKIYKETEDGQIIYAGTEYHSLQSVETKYYEAELEVATPDDIYQTFGLDRNNFKAEEDIRCAKLEEILGKANLDQLTFIQSGHGQTTDDQEVINAALCLTSNTQRQALIKIAASLIGRVPYEWGGKSTKEGFDVNWYTFDLSDSQKGLDCSGYIQWVLRTAGVDSWESLTNTTDYLTSSRLSKITADELEPGDLGLFYPDSNGRTNHIGMYMGNGYWIHCSSKAKTVTISDGMKFSVFRRLNVFPKTLSEPAQILTDDSDMQIFSEPSDSDNVINIDAYQESINPPVQADDDALMLMAKVVTKESYNEGYNGWVAVAQVIYNRVMHDEFANDIVGVLSGAKQFSTYKAACKMSDSDVDPQVLEVCRKVMAGELQIFDRNDVIGFQRAHAGDENFNGWEKYRELGNHAFYCR